MKKNTVIVAVLLALFLFGMRQNLSAKDSEPSIKVTLKNTLVIQNDNQVVGYAFFYIVDEGKRENLYKVVLLDENLKPLGSHEFKADENTTLSNAIYESGHIMLNFKVASTYTESDYFSQIFDLKGSLINTVPFNRKLRTLDFYKNGSVLPFAVDELYKDNTNVPGQGFVNVFREPVGGGINVQMINLEGDVAWNKTLSETEFYQLEMHLIGATKNVLLFFELEHTAVYRGASINSLVGIDPKDGAQLFKLPLRRDGYSFDPRFLTKGPDGNDQLVSVLSKLEESFSAAEPLGYSIGTLNDKTGKLTNQKDLLFTKELRRLTNKKEEAGRGKKHIVLQDIQSFKDGTSMMIGENLRERSNNVILEDLFLAKMDSNYAILNVKSIEKENVSITGKGIAYVLREMYRHHSFGYLYTNRDVENDQASVLVYGEFDGEKAVKAITFDKTGVIGIKQFKVGKEKRDSYSILRAKPGYILIMKYNKREKKLDFNLERLD